MAQGTEGILSSLNESDLLCNSSVLSNASVPEPPMYLLVLLSVIFALIFLLGVAGNVLVTCVVIREKALRNSVSCFVISLCVADLLVIIVCMPTAWVDVYAKDVWYFGEAMCKLVPYLENVVAGASVFTILFICVERHKAICQPLRRSSDEPSRAVKPICVIWTLCALASLPFVFFPVFRKSVWVDGTPINVCRHPIRYPWQKAYLVTVPIVFFVLPLMILIALYCMVGKVLAPNKGDTCTKMDENYHMKMKRRRQGLNTVVLIVLIFFASHLPFRVVSLWLIFESREVLSKLGLEAYLGILYFARVAFYLNHALNPILYNFVSRKFRAELREMCCKHKCCLSVGFLPEIGGSKSNFPATPIQRTSHHLNSIDRCCKDNKYGHVMINKAANGTYLLDDSSGLSSDHSDPGKRHGSFDNLGIRKQRPSSNKSQRNQTGKLASLMVFIRPKGSGRYEIDVDLCTDPNVNKN